MKKFRIADVVVQIDYREDWIYSDFDLFECDRKEQVDLIWTISYDNYEEDVTLMNWKDMGEFRLACYKEKVIVSYKEEVNPLIPIIVYEDNYSKATYYAPGNYENLWSDREKNSISEYLFVFHQEAFFLAMMYRGAISIHSSSIIYQEKGVLFSAQSGVGKTTHTNLWVREYGTPILDGDVALCKVIDHKAVVYGLPWAGTSDMFRNQAVELGAIVFLMQSNENYAKKINYYEAFQRMIARTFTPLWFPQFLQMNSATIRSILDMEVPCYTLNCKADIQALHVIKQEIDKVLSNKDGELNVC